MLKGQCIFENSKNNRETGSVFVKLTAKLISTFCYFAFLFVLLIRFLHLYLIYSVLKAAGARTPPQKICKMKRTNQKKICKIKRTYQKLLVKIGRR